MKINKIVAAGLLFWISTVFAEERKFVVPQFAAGSAQGLTIETSVTLVNLGTEVLNPARATLRTYSPDGTASAMLRRVYLGGVEAADILQREIPGRGAAVAESFSAQALKVGRLEITTEDNLAVEVLYKIFDSSGSMLTVTSLLPRPAVEAATLTIESAPQRELSSTVAVVNPLENAQQALVSVVVFDQFGNRFAEGELTLNPGEQLARNWTELVPELARAGEFLGTAEIVSDVPLYWLTLRQERVQLSSRDSLSSR
ncbi:MAG TPA: hypothetical protein PLM33_06065 [Acidobacteriota bacterium]|nr:hypothetical protein [Acidobacteriota bacterium]HRR26038.1 hypothetical protein [Acidobacteriota bacterium]HRR55747.1 hypothetical protein [Acidobacteriota bacterium]